jgi:glycosyltransferase involved in cell wall biosynthesis
MSRMPAAKHRVAVVTNNPAPYREPVFEILSASQALHLVVVYSAHREPDRHWDLQEWTYERVFLRERYVARGDRYVHYNPDVWNALRRIEPDVVITNGFNPTYLLAFLYAKTHGAKHIPLTDGTLVSELSLSSLHRVLRRIVYSRSHAFVGAGKGSRRLYQSYGIPADRIFQTHLCADNTAFDSRLAPEKQFDFLLCGRLTAVKNPRFALDVAEQAARALGRVVTIAIVGSGELEASMKESVTRRSAYIQATFAGFIKRADLPGWYQRSRIFLLPSVSETWGVVVNEACAAGLPVLISPVAGSADDLVVHDRNGFVVELSAERWAAAAVRLLTDKLLYHRMSIESTEQVQRFTYENAARGLEEAILSCHKEHGGRP